MMNIKCANPECGAELKYLRGGRLFLLDREVHTGDEQVHRPVYENVRVRKYFWLCEKCAVKYTIRRWINHGIELEMRRKAPTVVSMPVREHDTSWVLPGLVG
jgi:hypothetical protein